MDAPAHARDAIGGEEDHHQKTSVMKKVKNKAKKIKDALSKKRHDYGGDRGQGYEEIEEEYTGEEGDEETEEDPAIHEAAGNVHDGAAAKMGVAGREEHPHKGSVNLGKVSEDDPGAPNGQSDAIIHGNNQTNVTDSGSTGGVEPGVIPPFQQMPASEPPKRAEDYTTGRHVQFSPDSTSSTDPSHSENPRAVFEKDTGGVGELKEEKEHSSDTSSIVDKEPGAPKGQSDAFIPGSHQTNVTDSGSTGGIQPMVIPSQPEKVEDNSTTESPGQISPDSTSARDPSRSEDPRAVHERDTGGVGEMNEEEHSSDISSIVDKEPGAPKGQSDAFIPGSHHTNVRDSGSTGGIQPMVIPSQPEKVEDNSTTECPGQISSDSTSARDPSRSENPRAVYERDTGGVGEMNEEEEHSSDASSIVDKEPGAPKAQSEMPVSEQPERVDEYSATGSPGQISPDSTFSRDPSHSENPRDVLEEDTRGVGERPDEEKTIVDEEPGTPKGQSDGFIPVSHQTNVTDSGSTDGLRDIPSFRQMSVPEQPERVEDDSTTGSHGQFSSDSTSSTDHSRPENPEAAIEKDAGVGERHSEENRSSSTSAIGDKVASAKGGVISAAWGSTEYGKKIASTLYEKVAGTGVPAEVHPGNTEMVGDKEGKQDKGLSVMESLTEKLSPGEEDRALREVILKRQEEEQQEDAREEPIQKPREAAEELVRGSERSGSGERNAGDDAGPAGEGVVSKIKGAVTSLFSGRGASHAAAESGVQPGGAVEHSSEKQEGQKHQVSAS